MFKRRSNAVNLAKYFITNAVGKGSCVIDATAGNGKDTLFLAQLVGEDGKVYAFDVQKIALEKTFQLLKEHSLESRVELIHDSHHNLNRYVGNGIDGMMFNLGYLPGGDHSLVTEGKTTKEAIEKGLLLLKPSGVISIVVYYGHLGGMQEREQVEHYLSNLDHKQYSVVRVDFPNKENCPPYLILVQKQEEEKGEK